ncbi:MAG: type IV conjugative transfer system lipoprotein TraV [bacterium]
MREIKKIMMVEKFKQSAFAFCAVFLSGCAGMNSSFDCDVGSGGKCAPMHHINKMANYGAFTEKSLKADNLKLAEVKDMGAKQKIYGTLPIRSNEEIQQIWIGPYEDANGNYHEASYVYSVIKKGRWSSDPVATTTE